LIFSIEYLRIFPDLDILCYKFLQCQHPPNGIHRFWFGKRFEAIEECCFCRFVLVANFYELDKIVLLFHSHKFRRFISLIVLMNNSCHVWFTIFTFLIGYSLRFYLVDFLSRYFSRSYKVSNGTIGSTSLCSSSDIIFQMRKFLFVTGAWSTSFRKSSVWTCSSDSNFIDKVFLEVNTILSGNLGRYTKGSCELTKSRLFDTLLVFDNLIIRLKNGRPNYRKKWFTLDGRTYENYEIPGDALESLVWQKIYERINCPKKLYETFKKQSIDSRNYEDCIRERDKLQRDCNKLEDMEIDVELRYKKGERMM